MSNFFKAPDERFELTQKLLKSTEGMLKLIVLYLKLFAKSTNIQIETWLSNFFAAWKQQVA